MGCLSFFTRLRADKKGHTFPVIADTIREEAIAMSEDVLVQCCAPTLAGMKSGSLFSFPYPDRESMRADVRNLNAVLSPRGLFVLPLRYRAGKALLYVFRPKGLKRDLNDSAARELLMKAGYADLHLGRCLRRLKERICLGEAFPHEIGLFLGYPPEDVRGFIENGAQNCKFTGYWKVYGDEARAKQTFEKYRKCTEVYRRSLDAGFALSRLAVSV